MKWKKETTTLEKINAYFYYFYTALLGVVTVILNDHKWPK